MQDVYRLAAASIAGGDSALSLRALEKLQSGELGMRAATELIRERDRYPGPKRREATSTDSQARCSEVPEPDVLTEYGIDKLVSPCAIGHTLQHGAITLFHEPGH